MKENPPKKKLNTQYAGNVLVMWTFFCYLCKLHYVKYVEESSQTTTLSFFTEGKVFNLYNERSTTGGYNLSQTRNAGSISMYGRQVAPAQQQLTYYASEETVARRLRELPEDDNYYLSVYGYTKQQYLAFLMAEEFTFQLYQATQKELNQEPFDCNALLLQEI